MHARECQMNIKADVRKETVVLITAKFSEFDGDVRQWQENYFKIVSMKNTVSSILELDITSDYEHDAIVRVVTTERNGENCKGWMDSLGYKTKMYYMHAGFVSIDPDYWDDDVDEYYLE